MGIFWDSWFKGFDACGAPANHSVKGLAFPRRAKVISRKVWRFRAWRKSFSDLSVACHPCLSKPNFEKTSMM